MLVGSYLAVRPITITPEIAFKVLACTLQLSATVIVDARHHFDEIDFDFAAKVDHLVLVAKPTTPSLSCLRTSPGNIREAAVVGSAIRRHQPI